MPVNFHSSPQNVLDDGGFLGHVCAIDTVVTEGKISGTGLRLGSILTLS